LHFLFLFLFILFFDVENILNRILCFLKMQNHYVNAYSTTADKPMQRKVWHPCGDKKILSMHVSSFVDIFFFLLIFQTYYNRAQESQFPSNFFQSVTIEFYKWRCAVYCYKKKDNIIGWRIWMYCLFYVGEQQPISFFFNLSSSEHNIMENCSTFF